MKILLSSLIFALYSICASADDYYSDYVNKYRKIYSQQISSLVDDNQNNSIDPNCPDYNQGYSGCPIYDNNGKLIVFEGPEVSRKDAEAYVERYNKTH